jgi:putative selenium metabolism hydrolase
MFEKLNGLAAEFKPGMIDFCQRLVRVRSLPCEEKEAADLVLAEMERLGYDEVFRDEWGNAVGIIRGDLPGPALLYNGHLDAVAVGDLGEWGGYDPFGAALDVSKAFDQELSREEDTEVIHGRGTSDLKAGAAAAIHAGALLLEMRKRFGYKMKGTFILALVVMEEFGDMIGTIKLMEETFPRRGLKADACISLEPSSLKLALGSRGRMELKVTVFGVSAHGSVPWQGVNAVEKATRLIDRIREVVKAEEKSDPDLGKSSICPTIISCTPGTTATVPDRCVIAYDRRLTPEETLESCVAQIQRVIDELAAKDPEFKASVEVNTVERVSYTGKADVLPTSKEAYKLDPKHPVAAACAAALTAVGQPVKWRYWDFGTDLPVTHVRHGIPSIGYSGMQEYYAHRSTERVRVDYLEKSLAGYAAIYMKCGDLTGDAFKL